MTRPIKIRMHDREVAALQMSADELARDQVRQVYVSMVGQPAAEVFDELMRRLTAIGFSPNVTTVEQFALAIEGDYLVEEGAPRRLGDVVLKFATPPPPRRVGDA